MTRLLLELNVHCDKDNGLVKKKKIRKKNLQEKAK